MIGYANLNRIGSFGRKINRKLGEFEAIFDVIKIGLDAAGQGYSAYTEYQKLQQQEDALKFQQQKLASERQALADAKAMAEQQAQTAMIADQSAASAGIAAAAAQQSEVPTWVWVAGAVVVGGGAVYLLNQKRRRR